MRSLEASENRIPNQYCNMTHTNIRPLMWLSSNHLVILFFKRETSAVKLSLEITSWAKLEGEFFFSSCFRVLFWQPWKYIFILVIEPLHHSSLLSLMSTVPSLYLKIQFWKLSDVMRSNWYANNDNYICAWGRSARRTFYNVWSYSGQTNTRMTPVQTSVRERKEILPALKGNTIEPKIYIILTLINSWN